MRDFTLINGGQPEPPAGKDTRSARLKKLRAIEAHLSMARRSNLGPAAGKALTTAVATGILLLGASSAAENYLLHGPIPSPITWGIAVIPLLAAVYAYRREPYKEWTAKIYELLTEYDPMNKEAYASLQHDVRENGLSYYALVTWLSAERAAFPSTPDRTKDQFLKKRV
ncbi:MAG TPA: hypothetical protein VF450_17450 [Noviherbaspirillum sp.]